MPPVVTDRRRFRRTDGSALLINTPPLAMMMSYRQVNRCAPEAGGVLLGRYILDAPHIIVDEVTVPMKGDRRWFTTFHRSRQEHQEIIDKRWEESGGTCQYLGEWHTHPERVPEASCVDRLDWKRRLQFDVYDSDSLFFAIMGIDALRIWEGTRKAGLILLQEDRQRHDH